MLVFYIILEYDTFYFCGRTSEGEIILSVDLDDCMHFNECSYEFLKSMRNQGFQIMWGD